VNVTAADLLDFAPEAPDHRGGPAQQHQRRHPVHRRLARGNGCVPIHNLMEDAATAEISRSQVWQWIRSPKGVLDDGRKVTCKGLEPDGRRRGLRTLDLVMSSLVESGGLPSGWIVTLPKVTSVEQVVVFADVCTEWEESASVPVGSLRFEVQVETPQAILGSDGTAAVARMVHAAQGRLTGLHYGTYDYSAALGVTAANQSLDHPVADYAKAVLQAAAAGTAVRVSDGSSNVLPIGDDQDIERALRLHARLVGRTLTRGIYQGWDLHPGQLVTRYAATFAFYRTEFPAAADRLRGYLESTASGNLLDEPATVQAMASVLVRGLHCGALDEAEVVARSGVGIPDLLVHYRRQVG
jgi:hypothetical protein